MIGWRDQIKQRIRSISAYVTIGHSRICAASQLTDPSPAIIWPSIRSGLYRIISKSNGYRRITRLLSQSLRFHAPRPFAGSWLLYNFRLEENEQVYPNCRSLDAAEALWLSYRIQSRKLRSPYKAFVGITWWFTQV